MLDQFLSLLAEPRSDLPPEDQRFMLLDAALKLTRIEKRAFNEHLSFHGKSCPCCDGEIFLKVQLHAIFHARGCPLKVPPDA